MRRRTHSPQRSRRGIPSARTSLQAHALTGILQQLHDALLGIIQSVPCDDLQGHFPNPPRLVVECVEHEVMIFDDIAPEQFHGVASVLRRAKSTIGYSIHDSTVVLPDQ